MENLSLHDAFAKGFWLRVALGDSNTRWMQGIFINLNISHMEKTEKASNTFRPCTTPTRKVVWLSTIKKILYYDIHPGCGLDGIQTHIYVLGGHCFIRLNYKTESPYFHKQDETSNKS